MILWIFQRIQHWNNFEYARGDSTMAYRRWKVERYNSTTPRWLMFPKAPKVSIIRWRQIAQKNPTKIVAIFKRIVKPQRDFRLEFKEKRTNGYSHKHIIYKKTLLVWMSSSLVFTLGVIEKPAWQSGIGCSFFVFSSVFENLEPSVSKCIRLKYWVIGQSLLEK